MLEAADVGMWECGKVRMWEGGEVRSQDARRGGRCGRGCGARKAGRRERKDRCRGGISIGKIWLKREVKAVTEVKRKINASKLFIHGAESAFQKKENLRLRDHALCWMNSFWVPRTIKEMNCKPSCFVESGLFKPSLGMDFDVRI